MRKMFALLRHADHVTPAYFHEHWRRIHGELARELGFHRYEQYHVLRGRLYPFADAGYDGVSEVWYPDTAAAAAVRTSRHYVEKILPDEKNFVDAGGFAVLATAPVVAQRPPADGLFVKGALLMRRIPQASDDDLARLWDRLPGIVGAAAPDVVGCAISSARDVPQASRSGPVTAPLADAVVELWWDWTRRPGSEDIDVSGLAAALRDEPVDVGATTSLVGHVHPVVTPAAVVAPSPPTGSGPQQREAEGRAR